MPQYKLTYFDARARAESTRLLFAAAKKEYEDIRVSFAQWPEEKKKAPMGTLPYLVIDGKITVSQTMAINRYLAKEFGLYGANSQEALFIDEIAETAAELFEQAAKPFFAPEAEKSAIEEKFRNEIGPRLLGFIENSITSRAGKKEPGFAVGSKLSLADIMIFNALEMGKLTEDLSKYPRIKASSEKVRKDAKIAKWLTDRPQDQF